MGCCVSGTEKPQTKKESQVFTTTAKGNQSQMVQGRQAGYPAQAPYNPQPPVQVSMAAVPTVGATAYPANPAFVGRTPTVGVVAAGTPRPSAALMFVGLYRYDARTHEDLSFDKGNPFSSPSSLSGSSLSPTLSLFMFFTHSSCLLAVLFSHSVGLLPKC